MQIQKEIRQQKQYEPQQQLQGSHIHSPSASQDMLLLIFVQIQEPQLEYVCSPTGMSVDHIESKQLGSPSSTTSTILEFPANMTNS